MHFGKKVVKLWKSVFFSTMVGIMKDSSGEQGGQLKWPRASTAFFYLTKIFMDAGSKV